VALKVLHIWNTAGVPTVIAKFMDRTLGTTSWVMARKAADPFGFTKVGTVSGSGPLLFGLSCLLEARKYDIVHVHDWYAILPWLRRVHSKPLVFTAHSLRFKYGWGKWSKYIGRADLVTVVSTNLLQGAPEGTVLVPNPIDTDIFVPGGQHLPGTALYVLYNALEEARRYATTLGIQKMDVLDRWKEPVPYERMPSVLSRYEFFIDVRRSTKVSDEIIDILSKNALEALAVGCKVVRWDGKVVSGLPDENRPENVVKTYFDKYQRLVGSRTAAGTQ